jgi:hypothetical protein
MKSLVISNQKSRLQLQVAASLLLQAALVAPQMARADHASDHPERESVSAGEANTAPYLALLEKYETGELVYHAPGRRDDRAFGDLTSQAYAALVAKFESGELVFHAPGRRDDRVFNMAAGAAAVDVDSARWAALGDSYAGRSQAAADASSARYQALAEWYGEKDLANPELFAARGYYQGGGIDAGYLAANPEVRVSRAFGFQSVCLVAGAQC